MNAVALYPGARTKIISGGTAVTVMYAPLIGGFISNPASPTDQGVDPPESLFVDFTKAAGTTVSETTCELRPGETIAVPANDLLNVSVNAISSGHKFSAIVIQQVPGPPNPTPGPHPFPPVGPTSVLKTIPSYLYVQYNDDDSLLAFVQSFNSLAQEYVDWFNQTPLGVYASSNLTGDLLDWCAAGLYGMSRPSLSGEPTSVVGPFNTFAGNTYPFNYFHQDPTPFFATTDDTYKRILTWHLYRGDGHYFNVRWLKRRIARFLTGVNGSPGTTDQTYNISVSFGSYPDVIIDVGVYNQILKEAVEASVLELPFQFNFTVNLP